MIKRILDTSDSQGKDKKKAEAYERHKGKGACDELGR